AYSGPSNSPENPASSSCAAVVMVLVLILDPPSTWLSKVSHIRHRSTLGFFARRDAGIIAPDGHPPTSAGGRGAARDRGRPRPSNRYRGHLVPWRSHLGPVAGRGRSQAASDGGAAWLLCRKRPALPVGAAERAARVGGDL